MPTLTMWDMSGHPGCGRQLRWTWKEKIISRWAVSLTGCTVARRRTRYALALGTVRPSVVTVNPYFASCKQP